MCKSLSNTSMNLKTIRESLHLNLDEFAALVDRDGQTARNWERGFCSPNAESMFHLVQAINGKFGIRIDLNTVITGIVNPFTITAIA